MYPAYAIISYAFTLKILDDGYGYITNIVGYQIAVNH
jgi:hypothetical protein